jgi:hypothetical protein
VLSGGAVSTGAAAGGVVSLVGDASEAGLDGGVDLSSGAGVLGSGVVKIMSGASAVGDALSGSATVGSGASVDASSGVVTLTSGSSGDGAPAGGDCCARAGVSDDSRVGRTAGDGCGVRACAARFGDDANVDRLLRARRGWCG